MPKKMSFLARSASLALSLTLAAAAAEARNGNGGDGGGTGCGDSVLVIQPGFAGCIGPIGKTTNVALYSPSGQENELTALSSAFGGQWAWQGKSSDSGFGPFSANPIGSTTLSFDAAVKGLFIVALQGGSEASFYRFNGGAGGITSLHFDTTGLTLPTLSYAALYTAAAPVPEPQTYALMLAGLGAVGFVARRQASRRA